MIKMILWIAIVLSAIGIYLGAIQITFHAEKLGDITKIVSGISNWQDAVAQVQYYAIKGKRYVELYFAKSVDAKFALDIKYLQADADSLKKALDGKSDAGVILPKATLLKETFDRAKQEQEHVSTDAMAKVRDDVVRAYAEAQAQLDRLHALSDEYKQYLDKLNQLSDGAEKSASSSPTPIPTKIPLSF